MITAAGSTVSEHRQILTFWVLATASLLYTASLALVTPVLAQVRDNLDTSQDGATWVLTAYLVSAAALTPICGRLGDLAGRKRMLVIVLAVSSVGLVIAALATSLAPMVVGRAVQGLGGGTIPLAFGILRDELAPQRIGRAMSVLSALTALGAALGVVLAGPIVDGLGYHWLFWLPAIGSALTALVAWWVIPMSRMRAPGSIAWAASVLLAGWLVTLMVAISQGPRLGAGSPLVLACAMAALVLFGCWLVVELRAHTPLIDLRMLRTTSLWTTNLMALLAGSAMFASMAFTTQLTQTPPKLGYGFGLSLTAAGFAQLPTSGAGFVLGLLISRLVPPLDPKWVAVGATMLLTTGLLGLAYFHDELWQVCVANALTGGGLGGAAACQATLISSAVQPHETGAANGVSMTIRLVGGTIGTAVMSSVVASYVIPGATYPAERGYVVGFTALAITTATGTCAALAIPRRRRLGAVPPDRQRPIPDPIT